jgi:hypothetical protein
VSVWWIILAVSGAGAVGGIANGLLSDNGFLMPKLDVVGQLRIWRPGVAGNLFFGAVAAAFLWGLFGPSGASQVLPLSPHQPTVSLDVAALVGAFLVGGGGSRCLTNELDKRVLRLASSKAAAARPEQVVSAEMMTVSPFRVLQIADSLTRS